ncbi:MAG: succinylglutamate desuccinylase/aspartoacylase family protein, partial [archaeon]
VTGMATALDVMDEDLPKDLAGTVVCLPNLNPAGLRRNNRTSYYHNQAPNRHFPDADADATRPPKVQELIDKRVFDRFAEPADALLDLHTASVGSMPFVIRDRVLYGDRRDEDEAETLAEDLGDLVDALGLPVINEYAAEEYTEQNLQRSTAGAALNEAGIPACTLELGSHSVVEEDNRAAAVAAVYRTMVDLGMLDSVPDWADGPTVESPVDYPVKRHRGPYTETPGVVRYHVDSGDLIETGDSIADIVTPTGEHRTTVEAEHDGFVLGRWEGVAAYENDFLATLAVRDDGDLVVPRDLDDE